MRPPAATLYLAAGCGAGIGAVLRYLSVPMVLALFGLGPLWATGFVNVLGSFVIGLFAALTAPGGRLRVGLAGRQFVMAGLCGGFTTFSAMSVDTFLLAADGFVAEAALYIGLSVALSLAAAWLGHLVAERFNP